MATEAEKRLEQMKRDVEKRMNLIQQLKSAVDNDNQLERYNMVTEIGEQLKEKNREIREQIKMEPNEVTNDGNYEKVYTTGDSHVITRNTFTKDGDSLTVTANIGFEILDKSPK